MNLNPIRVVIAGYNFASPIVNRIVRDVRTARSSIDQLGRGVMQIGTRFAAVGAGAAYATGLTEIPKLALHTEHALAELANVGNLSKRQIQSISESVLKISKDTNQSQTEILAGLKTLVAAGLDPKQAINFLSPIGKAATAERADVNDLARSMYTVYDTMGVKVKDLAKALDVMTVAGQQGKFELADMAREFPALTASARNLGIQGVAGVAQLSAALQVAVKGAANPAEAATNLSNFLQKITSRETMGNFLKTPKKYNIVQKLSEVLRPRLDGSMADPIEEMVKYVADIVKDKDQAKLAAKTSFLFNDKQVLDFLKAMMPRLKEYRELRDSVMKADGKVDSDYKGMMATTLEQWKQLKITMATIVMPKLAGPLRFINEMLVKINQNTFFAKFIKNSILISVVLGAVLTTLGAVVSGIAAAMGVISSPIVLIVTGVMALSAAVGYLLMKWTGGFSQIKQVAMNFFYPVSEMFEFIRKRWDRFLPFIKLFGLIFKNVFIGVWKVISLVSYSLVDAVKAFVSVFTPIFDFLLNAMTFLTKLVLPKSIEQKIGLIPKAESNGKKEDFDPNSKFQMPAMQHMFDALKAIQDRKNTMDINMKIEGAPKGTKVDSKTSGNVSLNTQLGLVY